MMRCTTTRCAQPVFHERDYHLVTTEQELQQWVEELRSAGEFAVDTETTSINYMQAELVGFLLPQHLVGQLMCRLRDYQGRQISVTGCGLAISNRCSKTQS